VLVLSDCQPPLGEDGKPLIIPEESNAGAKVKASNPGGSKTRIPSHFSIAHG